MSKPIIQLNEDSVKSELKELVRNSVEETLNELLNKEAEELTSAAKYERTEARQGYRSGHYSRKLTTTTYMDFPSQHWLKIRTNNVIERMNREIRRRTRVVGTFPDGKSALMLVCARLRYVSGKEWGSKRYLCMKYLTEAATEVA